MTLIDKARSGDQTAQAKLYEDHFNVLSYYRKIWKHKLPYHVYKDLISVINYCYCVALNTYNYTRGTTFRTYLSRRIDWGIKEWVKSEMKEIELFNGTSVDNISAEINHAQGKVSKAIEKLSDKERMVINEQLQGKTYLEIARTLNISKQRVGHIRKKAVDNLKIITGG